MSELNMSSVDSETTRVDPIKSEDFREDALKYRAFAEAAFESIVLHSFGPIIDVNYSFEKLFGYTRDEARAMDILDLVAPETQSFLREQITDDEENIHEWIGIHKDGSSFDVESAGRTLRVDGLAIRVTAIRNVTRYKTIIAQREAARWKFEDLVDSIDGVIWECDARTFQFEYISHRVVQMLGFSVDKWYSSPYFWKTRVHPEDYDGIAARHLAESREGRSHTLEYRMIAEDGRTVWVRDYRNFLARNGAPPKLCGVMIDITLEKKTEIELHMKRQQLSGYQDLVTHDIANFATTLAAIIEILQTSSAGPLNDRQRDLLSRANRQCFEMSRLSENARLMLRLNSQSAPPPEGPLNLLELMRAAASQADLFNFDREVEFDLDCPAEIVVTKVPYLSHVFGNLFYNAVRYSVGKSARIEVRTLRDGTDDDMIRVIVRGGLAPAPGTLAAGFDPSATKGLSSGTGLALSIIRGVLERAGGSIVARSGRYDSKEKNGINNEEIFEVELTLPLK